MMLRYLIRRLGRGILTIFVSVTLVFFIVRAMPSSLPRGCQERVAHQADGQR